MDLPSCMLLTGRTSDTTKHKTSGVDMDELVGNTQGFAESG